MPSETTGVARVENSLTSIMSAIIDKISNPGQFMYYRITRATIQSGTFDQAMATMESIVESFSEINGLVTSRLIRISETELLGVAAYESKELLEASQTQYNELMSNMMPFLAAQPSVSHGEQVMAFDAE